MYSLDDFLLDLQNRGENAPLNDINNSVGSPTPVPQLQGDIANMDFSNFNYEDIDNANIYEKDGLYYSDNPYVNSIIGIESGHKANAHNASGAAGVFQFMPSTAKQYKLTNAYDPNESLRAYKQLTKDNIKQMKRMGLPITPTTIYIAHQQGVGGLAKIMTALRTGSELTGSTLRNVKNNSLGGYKGLQQYYDDWEARIKRG